MRARRAARAASRRGPLGLALGAALSLGAAAAAQQAPAPAAEAPAPATRVYVVRHAQAWRNVPPPLRPAGMDAAALDALTDRGFARAEAVGRRLGAEDVAAVYTSPARRARQTAHALAEAAGLAAPPIVAEGLRPLEHGSDPRAADGRWRARHWQRGEDPRPAGGESLADALARAARVVEEAVAAHPGRAVVVVTHGEIASPLLSRAAGVPPAEHYRRSFVGEGTISRIDVAPDGAWRLVSRGEAP